MSEMKIGFELRKIRLALENILPMRLVKAEEKATYRFKAIIGSIPEVGLVEPLVVYPQKDLPGKYMLKNGHLRYFALQDLGKTEADCLIATDDECYTYNARISRLPPIQEHKMIVKAVNNGVSPERLAVVLNMPVRVVQATAQINDVLNRMATDDLAKQLSCSYGFDINLSTVQIFQQYAAQGQSFFLASGDAGAYPAAIDEPADDPYITVVGGTTLTMTTGEAWSSETAWLTPAFSDGLGDNYPEEATGGGVSLAYPIPSWQQGISMTANQGSTTMRNLPDVSSVANNINIVWGNDLIGESMDWAEGGTSLAAPLWAGLVALANEQAAANGQPPVGFANPALYAIAKSTSYQSCFHDITTGGNTNSSSPTKYWATAGYDLCTGLGTPNGANLIPALLSPPLDNLRITPSLGFTAVGPGGGPFTVASQTYTLKNTSSTPLNWSLVNTSSWLTVSSTSGNLSARTSTTVTISLNPAANNFLINHASGNVVFNNLTAGTTQNRQFDLYVGNGGLPSTRRKSGRPRPALCKYSDAVVSKNSHAVFLDTARSDQYFDLTGKKLL